MNKILVLKYYINLYLSYKYSIPVFKNIICICML